jgi:hypothetical protein
MEKIKEFLRKPVALAGGAFLVGLIIGLVVLGWGLWPVQWANASPADLQIDFQHDYLCMTIDSYIKNQDMGLVQLRWNSLGDSASAALDSLTPTMCGYESTKEIEAFKGIVSYKPQASKNENKAVAEEPAKTIAETPVVKPESTFSIAPLLILVALTLGVGGVFVFLMKRKAGSKPAQASRPVKPGATVLSANKGQARVAEQGTRRKSGIGSIHDDISSG